MSAPADPVKQRYAQLSLQRVNLSGERRLAQIESIGRTREATGVGNGDEGVQMAKVHVRYDNFASIMKQ